MSRRNGHETIAELLSIVRWPKTPKELAREKSQLIEKAAKSIVRDGRLFPTQNLEDTVIYDPDLPPEMRILFTHTLRLRRQLFSCLPAGR